MWEGLRTYILANWTYYAQKADFENMEIYTVWKDHKLKPHWPPVPGDRDVFSGQQLQKSGLQMGV